MTYLDQRSFAEAERAFLEALDLAESTYNEFRMADVLTNMTQLYYFKRDQDRVQACERRFAKADGYSYDYASAQLFIVMSQMAITQGHRLQALSYVLRALWRMLKYGGFNPNVWASWARDWFRWRRRIRRLHAV
jgi:hypothetical protein